MMENSARRLVYDNLVDVSLELYLAFKKRLEAEAEETGLSYQQARALVFFER